MLIAWSGVVNVEATGSEEATVESAAMPGERAGPAPRPARAWAGFRAAGGPARRAAWWQERRPLTVAILFALVCLLYVAYLEQARSLGSDSDGASNVLQAWDMLHGNLLLRGWWLSDVSFYTTELPEYMLVELVHGLHAGDIYLAAGATYTLLVVLAAVLAKGRAAGTEGLVRVLIAAGIMLAPGVRGSAGLLLSSPDHVGTQVPLLLIWLAIDRLGDRWYLPWLVGVMLTWVQIADQTAVYVGAVPVIVVSAVRIYQRRESWRIDAGLLLAAAASIALAAGVLDLIRRVGGFVVAPASTVFATSAQLPHNVWLTVESVLAMFGADFFGMRLGLPAAVALLHFVGLILAAWACWVAARQLLQASDRLVPILIVGITINLAAFLLSTQAFDLASARDIAAVVPFGAVLAGRLIPGRPAARALVPALLAVLVGYAGVLGYYASRPALPPATQAVASWLTANHLTAGIGDYWAANITTAAASDRVRVRAVSLSCGRFAPYAWESKKSWYEPPNTATFLVLPLDSRAKSDGTPADATTQFGVPQRTARVGAYRVMVWDHDLLPALTSGFARGCGPRWRR
jgi:hypothetical protein